MRVILLVLLIVSTCFSGWVFSWAKEWKDKFIREVNYHYQTQQVKNAEIAARQMEIENQKNFINILRERINTLDEENAAKAKLVGALWPEGSEYRGPCLTWQLAEGKVTAVAPEIRMAVLSLGGADGVRVGDTVTVLRGDQETSNVVINKVAAKWSAGKVAEKHESPKVGDQVRNHSSSGYNKEGIEASWISRDLGTFLGVDKGLFITDVRAGSKSSAFGLEPQDVVASVDPDDLLESIRMGKSITVHRNGEILVLSGGK